MEAGNCADWASAHRILMNRSVEAAVFENGYRAIASEGLAYDRCLVGVVTNIDADDHLADLHFPDADALAGVARTQVDIVLPEGTAVLNAADPRVAEMADLCDGSVIFFAPSPETEALEKHREQGGRALFVRNHSIVLAEGRMEAPLVDITTLAIQDIDARPWIIENILAAAGAAWAVGVATDVIRAAIETFDYGNGSARKAA